MTLIPRGLVLAACAAALAGCPAPTPADAGVDAGVMLSPVELCDHLAASRCELVARCYLAFDRAEPADCRSLEQARCLQEYEGLRPSFEAGAVTIDSEKVFSCEARMAGSACPPSFPPGYPNVAAHPFSDCELSTGLLKGRVPSGEKCSSAVECQPGTLCVKPGGVCLGTCSSFAADGEPCAFGCAPGLVCDDQMTPNDPNDDKCAPLRAVNERCQSSAECQADLVCKTTCRPRGKKGESCGFDAERLSTCDPGLACDVTPFVMGQMGTCVEPKPLFERCRFHWSCAPGLVCADLIFDGFPDLAPMDDGVCRPPGEKDTNCPPTPYALYVGDQCVAGTSCSQDMKKCLSSPRLGETCSAAAQNCVGVEVYCKPAGSSDQGTCTGPAGNGDRCAFTIDATNTVQIPCSSGWCDATSTQTCRPPYLAKDQECTVDGQCQSGRCAVQQDRSLRCADACN